MGICTCRPRYATAKFADYVPNGLIPDSDDCGDYIRLRINSDGTIENWPENPDYSDFIEGIESVERIDPDIEEEPILDTRVEFTYSQLMAKLFRLPKFLQLEIGKALVANASEGFEEDRRRMIYFVATNKINICDNFKFDNNANSS